MVLPCFSDLVDVLASYPKLRSRDDEGVEKVDVINKYNVMYQEVK